MKNLELRQAWEFAEHTGKSIFLTGKAGTGKTTFLKTLKERSHKRMVVVAPTGVAAINAGGVTIHSFFQLPLSPYLPNTQMDQKYRYSNEKRKIMRTIDMLIIDEISMVRSDVLDAVDSVMRRFREHDKPFGGVQLVMIGDLHQLTPVVRPDEAKLLSQYYTTPYFFGSKALQSIDYVTIELHHVYRQQDDEFLQILNDIRSGNATSADMQKLNSRCDPTFHPQPEDGYIRLCTHNRMADEYNERELWALKAKSYTFEAKIEKDYPEYDYPTDRRLTLKGGAQVMFLKNDPKGRYYNGRIGIVTYVDDHQILVHCPGDEKAIDVEMETWENTKYKLNEETRQIDAEVVGTFTQYPLRLAWAITIHKSQGLTFEHAIIDAQFSFAPGQVYVALSRCKTLQGMVLASPIPSSAIINDPRVTEYVANQEPAAISSINRLPKLKEEYYRQLIDDLFNFRPIVQAETSLDRVMQEFLFGKDPLAALHHTALTDLQTKVIPVAEKWLQSIRQMTDEQVHASSFLERVQRSATYFASQLTDILDNIMRRTGLMEVSNKMVKKRLERAYGDMHDIWKAKQYLLEDISQNGFTPQAYLKYKQEAILKAMDKVSVSSTSKASKKDNRSSSVSTSEPKKPKIDTKKVSFDLYKQGKTIAEIAKERNLKPETIYGHLAFYALRGEIPMETILPAKHREVIERLLKNIGLENGTKPIKELCPPDVTYAEIRLTMNLLGIKQGKKTES